MSKPNIPTMYGVMKITLKEATAIPVQHVSCVIGVSILAMLCVSCRGKESSPLY
jgi:DMSO/TMAO reductase YedYZ heme-binding membrane subunit